MEVHVSCWLSDEAHVEINTAHERIINICFINTLKRTVCRVKMIKCIFFSNKIPFKRKTWLNCGVIIQHRGTIQLLSNATVFPSLLWFSDFDTTHLMESFTKRANSRRDWWVRRGWGERGARSCEQVADSTSRKKIIKQIAWRLHPIPIQLKYSASFLVICSAVYIVYIKKSWKS